MTRNDLTISLIEMLMQEYQYWQILEMLVRKETQLLISGDLETLTDYAQRKRETLARLIALQRERLQLFVLEFSEHSSSNCRKINCDETGSVRIMDSEMNQRLLNLTLGIQTIACQIAERSQANYALADCRVKRMWELNGWLAQEGANVLPEPLPGLLTAIRDNVRPSSYSENCGLGFSPTLIKLDKEFFAWAAGG